MINSKELEKIEAEINEREQREKQETGFKTLNTLAQKEFLRLLKQNSPFNKS